MKRLFLFITLFTIHSALAADVFAADVQINASVDKNVIGLDEQVVLQVQVSGNATNLPNPEIPPIDGFTAYSSGRSQNISIVNGQMSSNVTYQYSLVPQKSGKFTIPSVTLTYKGQVYRTNPFEITVTQQSPGQKPQSAAQPPARDEQPSIPGSKTSDAIFVTASVDKSSAYVNEQVIYTFKFFRRVNLLSRPQFIPPNFSGFWTEDLPPKEYYTTINGIKYGVSELKVIVFPTKPGQARISEATLRCHIQDFNRRDPFFDDDFFSGFFSQGQEKVLSTKPLSIEVKPLPEKGKPADFSGAVGNYRISASLDKKKAKANEPVSLTITVSGTGNIKGVMEPKLPDWNDFRKYETVNSLNIDKASGSLAGSKTFTTVIVPLSQGNKTIPSIAFQFFNPAKNAYETVKTEPLTLEVKPGEAQAAGQASFAQSSQLAEARVLNKDIVFIKTPAKLVQFGGLLYKKPLFILLNLIFVFVCFAVFIYNKWNEKLSENVAFARSLKASGVSKKYLKQAKKLMAAGRKPEFCTALSKALLEYIANKSNTSPEGLTFGSISELLSGKNVPAETITEVKKILNECDMVRFAPSSVTGNMTESLYEETARLINRLDRFF